MNIDNDVGSIQSLFNIDLTVASPLTSITGVLTLQGDGALIVPVGNNIQRPTTPLPGMIRFNNVSSLTEFYNGSAWNTFSVSGTGVTSVNASSSTSGLTVTGGPITSSGTLSFSLNAELQGFSTIATNGILVRTAAGTYTSRTATGTAGNITVTNGDGVAGNPTINLATVTQGSTGTTFTKTQLDTFGRVINNTAVVAADITALVDSTYVNVSGDSMNSAANLTFSGGGEILGLPTTPSGSTSATSKAYVDALLQGLSPKGAVRAATTVNGTLATAFVNGSIIDGVTLVTGDRILLKNQTTQTENGIYTVNASGAPTRAVDMDVWSEVPSAFVFVMEGTTLADSGWVCTSNQGGTIGSTAIVWVQFAGIGSYTAGLGLTLTGNVFSITSPIATSIGGTGLTTIGAANQFLSVNTGATGLEYKTITAGTGILVTPAAGILTIANTGVTSVSLTAPAIFTVSGSPVTTTGTLNFSLNTQTTNLVFAAPNGSTGTPTFRSLVYADLPIKLYAENPVTPTAPIATGTNSNAIGSGANAYLYGSSATASGPFATSGDAQHGIYVLRNITTTTTPTELFLDGVTATQRLVLPNNSLWTFSILIGARRTDATGGGSGYKLEGVVRKDASNATIAFVGTPSKSILGETNAALDCTITVDTTNGSLKISAVGLAATTYRWVATVLTTEITN